MSGIVNLKKEAGMTSHDAVFKLRKILQEKKIGHGGTLDPDVTGVLPIALGKATRLIEYMQEEGKVYEGEITLGFSTTTEDASGEVVATTPVTEDLSEEEIDSAVQTFVGKITQIPPMYSAVKVNGRKLYEYARAGETVERPQREISIYSFERTGPVTYENGCARFDFRVKCGKGTYVRTLSVDLGRKLGLESHMSRLVRTGSAGMSIDTALTLADITRLVEQDDWSFLQPIENGIGDLPIVELSEAELTEVSFGRFFPLERKEERLAAFYQEKLVAVLEKRDELYKPNKVFI
ncbi:tRNA pseudouridine(55) synthase TruB [Streptococcus gallolyticus]|nr:tRNA pseudouridine(55) synthase TruB [Streptococcus gallolyticus]MBY5041359.1 tRNA pseudouridine(55) synthase TruB [Streptococcus gallolyticus]